MNQIPEQIKLGADGLAVVTWVSALCGALTGLLGVIAAIGSAIWVWLRVYETRTVQDWIKRRKQ